jgi:hypothetical protein
VARLLHRQAEWQGNEPRSQEEWKHTRKGPQSATTLARERLNCGRVQPGRTEARDLCSPIRIEEDVARFERAVQQREAVGKPERKRNSRNRFRLRSRRPRRRPPKKNRRQRTLRRMQSRSLQFPSPARLRRECKPNQWRDHRMPQVQQILNFRLNLATLD